MKKLILLVVLACCAVASFAVPLPEGSDARITEVRQNNGKIVYVRLKEATTLNTPLGALEAVEEVFFYENGNIQKFQPAVSGEYVSPVGTLPYTTAPISFYESGAVEEMELATETDITGSVGRIQVAAKPITFHDNWVPSSVELAKDCQVKLKSGVVSARSGYRIFFHENGAIHSFTVRKAVALDSSIGKIYPQEGSVMELHPNGSLASVTPEDICMIKVNDTLYFTKSRSPIAFKLNGNVMRFSAEAQNFTFGKFRFTLEKGSTEMFVYDDGSVFFTDPGYVHLAGLEYRRHCNGLFVTPAYGRLIYWEVDCDDTSVYSYSYNVDKKLVSTSLNMNVLQYTPDTMKYFENPPFTFDQESNIISYLGFEKRTDPKTKTTYNHPVIVKVAIRPNTRVSAELQQILDDEPVIPTPQPAEPILNKK